jgi:hypothetical protein
MSKHNNANWDHYKLAGRERPGDAVPHDEARRRFSTAEAQAHEADAKGPHIPNQETASQPRAGGADADRQEQGAAAPQANTDAEGGEPTLSDDEGYTG